MKKRIMNIMALAASIGLIAMQGFSIRVYAEEEVNVTDPAGEELDEATLQATRELVAKLNADAGNYVLGFTFDVGSILSEADGETSAAITDFIESSYSITDMGDGILEIVDPEEFRQLMDIVAESEIKKVSASQDANGDMSNPESRLWARVYQTSDELYTIYFERGLRGGHEGEKFESEYRADLDGCFLLSDDESHPWGDYADKVERIVFYAGFGQDAEPHNMAGWFQGYTNLKSVEGLNNLNTSQVSNMERLFAGCTSLEDVNLSGMTFDNVSSLKEMFAGCTALTSVEMEGNASNVTDMSSMFAGCSELTSLKFECSTQNLTDLSNMFAGCSSLERLVLTDLNTENVTDMTSMFDGCSELVGIYVGEGFNTENVEESDNMFAGCKNLVGRNGTVWDEDHIDCEYARLDDADYFDNEDGTYSYLDGDYGYFRDDVDAEEPIPMTKDILVDLPDEEKEEKKKEKKKKEEAKEAEESQDGSDTEKQEDGIGEEQASEEENNGESTEDTGESDESGESGENNSEENNSEENNSEENNSEENASEGDHSGENNSEEGGSEQGEAQESSSEESGSEENASDESADTGEDSSSEEESAQESNESSEESGSSDDEESSTEEESSNSEDAMPVNSDEPENSGEEGDGGSGNGD